MRHKSSVFAALAVLTAVVVCGPEALAQQRNQAGCLGRVRANANGVKLYKWPSANAAEKILDLRRNEHVRVYTEYRNSSWYLVKVNRERPINGFVEQRFVDRLSQCFGNNHGHPNLALRSGREYVVLDSVEGIYLRDADGRNHAIGLMRARDTFIRHKLSRDGNQLLGWALSRGVNPRFRYGSVLVARKRKDGTVERFLAPKD